MTDFVHLHVHSDFSLLDGAAPVKGLAAKARSLGMKHLAITDHGNMFGVLDFAAACRGDRNHPMESDSQIHPIIGCEAYMAPASRLEKKGSENDNKYYHLVLLASSREGYHNLGKLASFAYTEGFYYKPRIDEELLIKYHAGIIGLSACIAGEIPSLILRGKTDEAEKRAERFREIFGKDNFFLEIQDHGLEQQKTVIPELIGMSRRTGIPLVATNDIHFIEKEDWAAQDILLCVSTNKKRSDEKRLRYSGNEYFKSGDEMASLFSECPEAITNTVAIAERCETDLPDVDIKDLPRFLPDFEIPPEFSSADEYLTHLTMDGLPRRYPDMREDVRQQARYELDVIIKMGFTGYFLIVADFINWAKDNGISVGPGRGSGAGSIVAYALRITDIDPLKYKLLFERFLNPERISMPDFDVDFCNERREEVFHYVTEKYGKDKVGQIITFGTLGAKQVIKDVARALDISLDESDMITKLIPKDPKITLKKAIEQEKRLADLAASPAYQELFTLASKLEGKKRHASLHAAGVVIGRTELSDLVPLYRDSKTGGIATQYTMGLLESQGLVKMDFLGLKTLDLIKHTEDLIRLRGGDFAAFSVENADENDEATFRMLGEGKNEGVFQFERDWWKDILRQSKPSSIDELTALTSLGRPGPMDYIPQYIACKWGKKPIRYPDPCLEDILKETYGVIVYQEQVMQVAQRIAGYSLGQADILRRAMGKKKREIIEKEKGPFLEGAVKNGFSREHADDIYEILAPFAGYGFNKSHAAAYSVLSFRTAYLKAHFPAEFMAANLSNEIGSADKDKLSWYIEVSRGMGIPIDPPDINRSGKLFAVVEGRIVYGLKAIKGVGDGPADEILLRRKDGPYKSFIDFLERVTLQSSQPGQHIVSRKVLELLIKTGAFDSLGVNRATMLANMEAAADYAQNKKDETRFGQASLFEDSGEKTFPDFEFTQLPEMDRMELLNIEKELIGFYFSGHPLDEYREWWEKNVKLDASDPDRAVPGNYALIGILKTLRPVTDKTGKAMAFGSLEDYRGEIDLAFFGDVWANCRDRIHQAEIAAVQGRLDKRRGKMSLQVQSVLSFGELKEKIASFGVTSQPLDQYRAAWEQTVDINLSDLENAETKDYTLIGYITNLRRHITKDQKEMAFATLEDYNGSIDLVFFTRTWEINRDKVAEKTCIACKGKLDKSRDKPGFIVSSLLDLGKLRRSAAQNAGAPKALHGDRVGASASAVPADAAWQGPGVSASGPAASGVSSGAVSGEPAGKKSYRELHIRLKDSAAGNEETLYSLRDFLIGNPGPAQVFIHVPSPSVSIRAGKNENGGQKPGQKPWEETIIRTDAQLNTAADNENLAVLEACEAVAEVWGT
ncbi:MAG: DNA polymerase III subunit alpha [Treponema sp.]|jgi:DNA polymerase-3 subunit alpha|nr:DNA polymerase III subunit alpha [Treponema sp.]